MMATSTLGNIGNFGLNFIGLYVMKLILDAQRQYREPRYRQSVVGRRT